MRNFSIKNTIWKNPGHELDEVAQYILNEEKKIVFLGKPCEIKEFKNNNEAIPIEAAITEEKWDRTDIKEISLEELFQSEGKYICICVSRDRSEYERIKRKVTRFCPEYIENQTFFQGEVFQAIYYVYKRNEIRIDRIEIF